MWCRPYTTLYLIIECFFRFPLIWSEDFPKSRKTNSKIRIRVNNEWWHIDSKSPSTNWLQCNNMGKLGKLHLEGAENTAVPMYVAAQQKPLCSRIRTRAFPLADEILLKGESSISISTWAVRKTPAGDQDNGGNHYVSYKVLSLIIFRRLPPKTNAFIGSYQSSFIDGWSAKDQIFIVPPWKPVHQLTSLFEPCRRLRQGDGFPFYFSTSHWKPGLAVGVRISRGPVNLYALLRTWILDMLIGSTNKA